MHSVLPQESQAAVYWLSPLLMSCLSFWAEDLKAALVVFAEKQRAKVRDTHSVSPGRCQVSTWLNEESPVVT